MNSFDISSHLPTTYYYYYYYNRRHLSPNLLHRTKKKIWASVRACELSRLMPGPHCCSRFMIISTNMSRMPSFVCGLSSWALSTPRFSVYLYSFCKRYFFFCSPYYFILLSVNIAMMILNFFTRRLLIVLARTHSVRSKPYSYQKISPPQQGRINWLVSLLTTITKKTDFKKDSLFLRIMMLYVQWSSFTSLHNYWRFSNEIMWIQLHCVILFCARSRIAAFSLTSNSFTR